jgi:hypothetical protein
MPSFFTEKLKLFAPTFTIKQCICACDRESKISLRDKTNSCKVANKKTGFPFNKKQYENLKLSE